VKQAGWPARARRLKDVRATQPWRNRLVDDWL
jgi:hypothetical protein